MVISICKDTVNIEKVFFNKLFTGRQFCSICDNFVALFFHQNWNINFFLPMCNLNRAYLNGT